MDHHDPVQVSPPSEAPNHSLGDTTFTKLFVGGLAWETNDESLRGHFEQYGEILEAVVIVDKNTGRSRGYGFVTFTDPESARRACGEANPVIDGRRANCNLACLGRHQATPYYHRGIACPSSYFGHVPIHRGPFIGNSGYYQPLLYDYRQGCAYPPYRYITYGTEYGNPQDVNITRFVPAHRIPGSMNLSMYSFGQYGQLLPSGYECPIFPNYEAPGHQSLQFRGSYLNGASTTMSMTQASYTSAQPHSQPQSTLPERPPRFVRDQMEN